MNIDGTSVLGSSTHHQELMDTQWEHDVHLYIPDRRLRKIAEIQAKVWRQLMSPGVQLQGAKTGEWRHLDADDKCIHTPPDKGLDPPSHSLADHGRQWGELILLIYVQSVLLDYNRKEDLSQPPLDPSSINEPASPPEPATLTPGRAFFDGLLS